MTSAPPRARDELVSLLGAFVATAVVTWLAALPGPATLEARAEPRTASYVALCLVIVWLGHFVGTRVRGAGTRAERIAALRSVLEGGRARVAMRLGCLALAPLAMVSRGHALALVPAALVMLGLWHAILVRTLVRVARDPSWPRAGRVLAVVLTSLAIAPPTLLASWGVFSSLIQSGASRLVHLTTRAAPGERDLTLETDDGLSLEATWRPVAAPTEHTTGVLLVHGFADGRAQLAPFAERLSREGLASLRVTLRAHGRSEGALVTFTHRERLDVIAAADALLSMDGVRDDCFAALGVSMGGGTLIAASDTLVPHGLGSLVALAPPSDFSAIVARALPPPPWRGLATAEIELVSFALGAPSPLQTVPHHALEAVPALPLLVFHSRADRTVPYAISEALVRAHPRVELVTIADVSHAGTPSEVLRHHADRVIEALRAACP